MCDQIAKHVGARCRATARRARASRRDDAGGRSFGGARHVVAQTEQDRDRRGRGALRDIGGDRVVAEELERRLANVVGPAGDEQRDQLGVGERERGIRRDPAEHPLVRFGALRSRARRGRARRSSVACATSVEREALRDRMRRGRARRRARASGSASTNARVRLERARRELDDRRRCAPSTIRRHSAIRCAIPQGGECLLALRRSADRARPGSMPRADRSRHARTSDRDGRPRSACCACRGSG